MQVPLNPGAQARIVSIIIFLHKVGVPRTCPRHNLWVNQRLINTTTIITTPEDHEENSKHRRQDTTRRIDIINRDDNSHPFPILAHQHGPVFLPLIWEKRYVTKFELSQRAQGSFLSPKPIMATAIRFHTSSSISTIRVEPKPFDCWIAPARFSRFIPSWVEAPLQLLLL